jgi:two-component system sensor histidine kinase UhpB
MMAKDIRLTLVEDDPLFSQMIHFQLSSLSTDFQQIQRAATIKEFEESLSYFHPDVVLLDLNLPDSSGLETYMTVKHKCPNSAIVILSGSDDEELSARIVQNGAQDYILKSDVNGRLLNKSVQYSLERMRQNVILAESEKKFREVFENSPIPMLTAKGEHFVIQMANRAFSDLYGGRIGEFNGKSLHGFNAKPEDQTSFDLSATRILKNLHHKSLSGDALDIELIANKLMTESDLYICLIIDKTEELRFQEEKYKLINSAQENEKHKIAREIHDGLAQNLVLMNLLFESFDFTPEQQEQQDNFSKLIKSTIEEAKGISYSLLPPELESGFLSGLRNMINRINYLKSHEFIFQIDEHINEDDFNGVDRFNLFRIVQEFINNSIKHAKSKTINLDIKRNENGVVCICIHDNGVGFDQTKSTATLGIQNMLNRMKLASLNGFIESSPGNGTTLKIYIEKAQEA